MATQPIPFFPRGTAELEEILERDFLGEDLPARVSAAQAVGDPVILAVVMADLETRRSYFHKWRSARIGEALGVGHFRVQFNELDAQSRADAHTRPLADLVTRAADAYEKRSTRDREILRASKEKLRAAMRSLHCDPDDARPSGIPDSFVVLPCGKVTWFPNYRGAKDWGRATKGAHFLGVLDLARCRWVHLDPDNLPDTPDLAAVPQDEPTQDAAADVSANAPPPEQTPEFAAKSTVTDPAQEVPAAASPPAPEGLASIVTGGRRGK